MVIMITAYGREVLADARDHSAPPFVDFLTKPVTPKQLADSVLHALHGEQGAPANPPRAGGAQRLQGVRLLVVEDNALNRRSPELLSSEAPGWPSPTAGWRAFSRCWRRACVRRADGHADAGYRWSRGDPRIRADGRFAGLPIPAMTANASLADREAAWRRA